MNAQAGKETFRCLWQGCKVYNRPSCSRYWLERHVPSHGGTKLFRCIVDDCGQRYNTHVCIPTFYSNYVNLKHDVFFKQVILLILDCTPKACEQPFY